MNRQLERVHEPASDERESASEPMRWAYSVILRSARRILKHHEDAEDVAQEVLLRVLRKQHECGLVLSPAWLGRVTINLCLNRLRDERRRRELMIGYGPEQWREASPDTNVLLRELLRDIPRDLEHPVLRHYLDDESHPEIAKELGVSRRTVGNRIAAFHAWVNERA